MNMKMIAGACMCTAAIVGCVSLEERLASTDPAVRKEAEQDLLSRQNYVFDAKARMEAVKRVQDEEVLCNFAMTIADPKSERYQDRRPEAMVAVEKITKDELLSKIAVNGASSKIRSAAFGKIKTANIKEEVKKVVDAREDKEQEQILVLLKRVQNDENKVKAYVANLKEDKLIKLLKGDYYASTKGIAGKRLLLITEDTATLFDLFNGKLPGCFDKESEGKAFQKIVANVDKVTSKDEILSILQAKNEDNVALLGDTELRKSLLSKLSDEVAVEFVFDNMRNGGCYPWSKTNLQSFRDGILVASVTKNPSTAVKLLGAIFNKIGEDSKSAEGDKYMPELISMLPKFSADINEALICMDATSWVYFVDNVTEDVALRVLMSRKAKTPAVELKLLKKLPNEKLDLALYDSARADVLKQAIYARMTPELQKQVREANEKAFAAIVEKAKSASKETFALEGFYLGMSWADMKIVLAHHFPDYEIIDKRDGKDKDSDWVIYLPDQRSPFCYADAKEKKVYQFNFGKKMLKKWYKYDVQDYAQWASAYSREHKIDMQYKMVEKEATVYEPMDPSRSYRVWFYQHSYQYKHNAKEYRMTYFGDEKDFTVHGGVGGAAIKELAAPKFRYTRGDPGSLRVRIEKD